MTMNLKRQYFNELARQWDSLPTISDASAKIGKFLSRSARPGAQRILDVGCGTGILLPFLFEMYPHAALYVEYDFAEAMLTENARKFSDARAVQICGDAQNLPFLAESFDLILCFSALPHLGDTLTVVNQCCRLLRPGGVFTTGHMAASRELNEFHHSLKAPITHDRLLPASDLGKMLEGLGASPVYAEEETDWYFVRAERRKK